MASSTEKSLDGVSGKILDVLVSEYGVANVVAYAQRTVVAPPVVKRRAVVKRPVTAVTVETKTIAELVQPMQALTLGAPAIPVSKTSPNLSTKISTAVTPVSTATVAKKAVTTIPRCAARVYGDKVLIPGTKNVHGFKHAQCERNGSLRFVHDETDTAHNFREVLSNYEETATEGNVYMCKVCKNRWEKRTEKPDNWHGIFDCADIPATSHFIGQGSAWYAKYATVIAAAAAEAAKAAKAASTEKKIEPAKTS